MEYIQVKSKKTGQTLQILEGEFNDVLFEKIGKSEVKEEKTEVKTKEEKNIRQTKAKVITSKSFNESKD